MHTQPNIHIPLPTNIKIYTAIMQQAGTAAPTATILKNDIGNIIWTRNDVGAYQGTLTGAFPSGKTIALTGQGLGAGWYITAYPQDPDTFLLYVAFGTASDTWQNVYLEIRIYTEPQHQ